MNSSYRYSLESGEIMINSVTSEELVWRGKLFDINARMVNPIRGANDAVILLDYYEAANKKQKNLLRINPFGYIIWIVGDPEKETGVNKLRNDEPIDVYTGITHMKGKSVVAYAWSGFSDEIDLETGTILRSEFVK